VKNKSYLFLSAFYGPFHQAACYLATGASIVFLKIQNKSHLGHNIQKLVNAGHCLFEWTYTDCVMVLTPTNVLKSQCLKTNNCTLLQAISAHHMWLSYLIELWSIVSPLGDGRTSAARHQFGRLLHTSLQDPSVLTHHPAGVGAYFRLLQLGLVYSRSLLLPGVSLAHQATPMLLLFDQILRAVSWGIWSCCIS
jgi:hypothetical protein